MSQPPSKFVVVTPGQQRGGRGSGGDGRLQQQLAGQREDGQSHRSMATRQPVSVNMSLISQPLFLIALVFE